uniref:Glycoprotein n=1 Tax=Manly virus TaxID=2485873 RepID=A0A3G3BTN3_9VIRU|nr:glycoprotein [Manly virus]
MYCLLWVLCLLPCVVSEWKPDVAFAFPEDRKYIWKRINVSDMECPAIYNNPSLNPVVRVNLRHPEFTGEFNDVIKGFICTKLKFAVKCSVNFFGWKTYQHSSQDLSPVISECTSAVEMYRVNGQTTTPAYPTPNCGWMAEHWAEESFIVLTDHPVHSDPYSGELVDKAFPGGTCATEHCQTIHHGSLWIPVEKVSPSCKFFKVSTGYLGTTTGAIQRRLLYSTGMGVRSLAGICRMSFCGHEGWRLSTGEFVEVPGDFLKFTGTIPNCAPGLKISEPTVEGKLARSHLEIMDQEARLQCLSTLAIAVSTKKVSPFILSLFTPTHPGKGKAYRLHGSYIEEATVPYIGLRTLMTTPHEDNIGIREDGTLVSWTDWVNVTGMSGLSGPNGIIRFPDGKILIPNSDMYSMRHSLLLTMTQELQDVPHPHREIEKNQTDSITKLNRDLGTDGAPNIGDWFRSPGGIAAISIPIVILIAIILFCLLKNAKCTRKTIVVKPQKRQPNSWANVATTSV